MSYNSDTLDAKRWNLIQINLGFEVFGLKDTFYQVPFSLSLVCLAILYISECVEARFRLHQTGAVCTQKTIVYNVLAAAGVS
jgi:hypothetical protein